MDKLTLDDLSLAGRRVLVRVDFNVPLGIDPAGPAQQTYVVTDDTRIRAALPTIRAIAGAGAKAILISHLGRPRGKPDPKFSLAPVADRLSSLLDQRVRFVSDTLGPAVQKVIRSMPGGSVLLLENTRFFGGETQNEPAFAQRLAALGDVFVNDAFGTAHRAHASNVGVASYVEQAAAGYLLARELEYLVQVLEEPEHPFVALLGGAKVSDKIGVIRKLAGIVDTILVGGAMSYTFLKALGRPVGLSLVEDAWLEEARSIFECGKIRLPVDHVTSDAMGAVARVGRVSPEVEADRMGVDIGPDTCSLFRSEVLKARTIVWNGPMGIFENPDFAGGTRAMAEAMGYATRHNATTVVGGGDSVAAIVQAGYADRVTHVSTGGGAMLAYLEGKTLPGLAALTDRS